MTWEVRGHWWGPGDVGQDGVQGPGKYFGLDPWGSVQEVARPSTSVSHPKGRPRQLPLETRGEPAGGSLLDQKGSAQASGSPGCGRGSGDSQGNPAALASTLTTTFSNHKHSLTFSRLQESGHPEEGAQWGAQRSPITQVEKLRLGVGKGLPQGHPAGVEMGSETTLVRFQTRPFATMWPSPNTFAARGASL